MGKQSLYYRHWVRNGVDLVNDLLNERGEFFSFEEFINKFNVHTNFVEYRGVISAIKKAFPKMFDNPGDTLVYPTIPFNFDILYKDKKGSRRMYDIIVSRKLQVRKYVDKWENKLGVTYDFLRWSIIFNTPFKCTTNVKLRWFQFRLIHRILGTNAFLFKIGKTDSSLCTFCSNASETLIHIFCHCNVVMKF